jgi:hypothetical protein
VISIVICVDFYRFEAEQEPFCNRTVAAVVRRLVPRPAAPAGRLARSHFPVCVHYYTRDFGEDRWAVHYYTAIRGHELVTRRDLIPAEPDHPRAGQWYYKLQLGPLQHKIPPIVSARWRRITFIITSGDRFMQAAEINDLFEQESPAGRLYVKLCEKTGGRAGVDGQQRWDKLHSTETARLGYARGKL